jgi:hypothetical protein
MTRKFVILTSTLFNDTFNSQTIESNDRIMNEYERMWKEEIVA